VRALSLSHTHTQSAAAAAGVIRTAAREHTQEPQQPQKTQLHHSTVSIQHFRHYKRDIEIMATYRITSNTNISSQATAVCLYFGVARE